MIYHWVCNNMGDTCGARPGYSSGAHVFTLDFSVFLFARFFFHRFLCSVLHIIVCPFVIFLLAVVLSVLLFTACDYLFGIFQNFLFLIQDFRQEEKG